MYQLTPDCNPIMTPEKPARPAPKTQTVEITFSTSIPEAEARAGLSATARVALPAFVRRSQKVVSPMRMMPTMLAMRSFGVMSTGPMSIPA